jgi:hypothetical protein
VAESDNQEKKRSIRAIDENSNEDRYDGQEEVSVNGKKKKVINKKKKKKTYVLIIIAIRPLLFKRKRSNSLI